MIKILLILLGVTAVCNGSWVAWDYDLRSTPPGWEFEPLWVFGTDGVRMDEFIGTPYTTVCGNIYSLYVVIPGGCDSIVLHVEQDISVMCTGNGFAGARLYYRLNGVEWVELFSVANWYQSTEPLHKFIPVAAGQALDVRFEGYVGRGNEIYPGSGSIDWLLYDLTLTFYGEEVSLEQATWGAIKGPVD